MQTDIGNEAYVNEVEFCVTEIRAMGNFICPKSWFVKVAGKNSVLSELVLQDSSERRSI